MNENSVREHIARTGHSLFNRGLTFGSTGNISVRIDDGWLMTPTGSSLGNLDPARISKLSSDGSLLSGDVPTKESVLHLAMYNKRPNTSAVVHLHSTHSTAVSCMAGVDTKNMLPPLTAYYVMRIGTLPMLPFFSPGDIDLAKAVGEMASKHHAIMLANHGPIVCGTSLSDATYSIEELEETAKLFLLLQSTRTRPLTEQQVKELKQRFPLKA